MKFALASSYEFLLAITVIVSATLGFYAPEIGMFLFQMMDFG